MVYTPVTIVTQGGAAETDPVQELYGPASTAFEFDTSSLGGLTALSPTPDAEDANTTVAGCYYLLDNAGEAWCGRYFSAPAAPFTAISVVQSYTLRNNFNEAALFIGEATPGVLELVGNQGGGAGISQLRYTTPTLFAGGGTVHTGSPQVPHWLAIRVNSSSSVDFLYSYDAVLWIPVVLAKNPAITISSVGIGIKAQNTSGFAAAFDYLRVWNSALTFKGF